MFTTMRVPAPAKKLSSIRLAALLTVVGFCWAAGPGIAAGPEATLQVVTDRITYNVGDSIRLKVIGPSPRGVQARYSFTVRYLGDENPVAKGLTLGPVDPDSPGYHLLWSVPPTARTGRYEVDLRQLALKSQEDAQDIPRICSFVVHRQPIHIVSAEVAEPYYTSGDTIGCRVKIENLSGRPLTGLRLEFSERYWPWIAQQRDRIGGDIAKVQSEFALTPHQLTIISASKCAVAKSVSQPSIKQYAAVLWDRERKNVLALSFTPLVFINPAGVSSPHPYPSQYIYPSLDKVNTASYRQFHQEESCAAAIEFDTQHTQYSAGADAAVKFTVSNPTDSAWRKVTVRALILGPSETEVAKQVVAERLELMPHGPKWTQEIKFTLPPGVSGHFHIGVDISDASGQVLASNILQLGVNPLPKSVIVFCAHEDDDSTQMGFIRSLVENQIPLRIVYFTSGDAGGCDRYFQHSCGPAEALSFGGVRMQEARAALGHLGVPQEDIIFLGLPDGGSGKIWYDHAPKSNPYPAVQLASDRAPYEGILIPNLPFARDAVVSATEEIIKLFQPEVIFTVHPPAEGHIDHIVNNFFVVKAMQDLVRSGAISPDVELRVDRIFDPQGHPSTPYHYESHPFYVSGQAMALTQEAIWFYQSQEGNQAEGNLQTWSQLERTEGYRKVLDWKQHEGWNEKE